ncbi:bifunctional riboflavin kinase/FAD synthetase [Pelagibius sp. Alg239-R121]|uniref:bifunctional riboflavin kinase/FAD synthetase n=1 Tax=Pelagibius sp. Alg239-R121 TaxID=2993448 RepID=UPI0024A6835E|nr:bifunctional riboflavin kinase/FAD synthetase [Pelagibius sp. Alg239-R121]
MTIFHSSSSVPAEARGAVVAIGNFDGVHLGHQAVLAQARAIADRLDTSLAVLTFEPHPRSVFKPDLPTFRLTPLPAKVEALKSVGVDHVFVLDFTPDFSKRSAEDFMTGVLQSDLGARHIVVGWDFCFGHKRGGDAALLTRRGADLGFGVTVTEAVKTGDQQVYSSSRIRECLLAGDLSGAAALLGRPWEVDGMVLHGDKRGRTIGVPTANLSMEAYMHPNLGVYAVRAGMKGGDDGSGIYNWVDGVANLGRRPTVEGSRVQLEVHLFDFDEDLYGRFLRVQLIEFLRGEKKFDGLDSLKAQITSDCEQARRILAVYPA